MGIWASKIKKIKIEEEGGFAVFDSDEWIRKLCRTSVFFKNEIIMFELERKVVEETIQELKQKKLKGYNFINPYIKGLILFKRQTESKFALISIEVGLDRLKHILAKDFKEKDEKSIIYYAI